MHRKIVNQKRKKALPESDENQPKTIAPVLETLRKDNPMPTTLVKINAVIGRPALSVRAKMRGAILTVDMYINMREDA